MGNSSDALFHISEIASAIILESDTRGKSDIPDAASSTSSTVKAWRLPRTSGIG